MPWVVAVTKARAERTAVHHVGLSGFDSYLPFLETGRGQFELLFPRYLFVLIQEQWHWLISTPGIIDIVRGSSGGPAVMPERELKRLWRLEGPDGIISMSTRFRKGQKLRYQKGLINELVEYVGVGKLDRSIVLMKLLGSPVRTEVSESALVAA